MVSVDVFLTCSAHLFLSVLHEADAAVVGLQLGQETAWQITSKLHGAVGDENQVQSVLGPAGSRWGYSAG